MSRALLQLNDLYLNWQPEQGSANQAMGIVHVTKKGLVCGEEAWKKLWIEPQHSYTQHWQQFNQKPMPQAAPGIRNTADLVFHQLQQLIQPEAKQDKPEQILIAAPGHFRNNDLALLLAIAQSLDLSVSSFIDPAVSAVAAIEPLAESVLYVDMQLHQTLLVEVRRQDKRWVKGATITLADCGLLQLLNIAAHFLANLSIHEHRFDPLNIAVSSQRLYDQLFHQLLLNDTDFSVEFEGGESRFVCNVSGSQWHLMLNKALASLIKAIQDRGDLNGSICLHKNSQWLARHLDIASPTHVVDDVQISRFLFQNWQSIIGTDVVYIDALDQAEADERNNDQSSHLASHLLLNNAAYSLQQGVWLAIQDDELQAFNRPVDNAVLMLKLEHHNLHIKWQSEGKVLSGYSGESFILHNQRLQFISVVPHVADAVLTPLTPVASSQ